MLSYCSMGQITELVQNCLDHFYYKMIILTLLVLFLRSLSANKQPLRKSRIVNGIPTNTNEWPWMVSLRFNGTSTVPLNDTLLRKFNGSYTRNSNKCGATLIRSKGRPAVLTAAHCLDDFDTDTDPYGVKTWSKWDLWIDVYRDDITKNDKYDTSYFQDIYKSYHVDYYVYHEKFSHPLYDIGIIFLDIDEKNNQLPDPVLLNYGDHFTDKYMSHNFNKLVTIGYGYEADKYWNGTHQIAYETDTLEYTYQYFINDSYCNKLIHHWEWENAKNETEFYDIVDWYLGIENPIEYDSNKPYNWLMIEENSICTSGENTGICYGDSGGPLVVKNNKNKWIQIGVTSWVYNCAHSYAPSGFTNITFFAEWIQNTLDENDIEDVTDNKNTYQVIYIILIIHVFMFV
eukprot:472569_1